MENKQEIIEFETVDEMMAVFGNLDEYIKMIQKVTGAQIAAKDGNAVVTGDEASVKAAAAVLRSAAELFRKNEYIDDTRISYLLDLSKDDELDKDHNTFEGVIAINHKGRPVKCRSLGQKKYVDAIGKNTVVFGIGPAGTGKTYLAMAKAVVALKNKEISRIILTRPAVEAGENLGFLPGDLQNKVDPYLRPLYDALYDFMGGDAYQKLSEKGVIEVAPLAYMRGRTLSDAFIILDEAQNCTMEQMKMFLTRFGEGSKVVVIGDVTQVDLPESKRSGLKRTAQMLSEIDGIESVYLTSRDVVRHNLVKEIVKAFDKMDRKSQR